MPIATIAIIPKARKVIRSMIAQTEELLSMQIFQSRCSVEGSRSEVARCLWLVPEINEKECFSDVALFIF
jgi:hypothetical protein